ncbi:hypothetical protein [Microbacterium sp. GXS0129]|uniref:hypothetical protein n=1 Tax=Microbacterium sp. GXS0129 TaxID=3377836 RepID=UPI00383B100E
MQRARQGRRTMIGAVVAVLLIGGVSAGAWAITREADGAAAVCGDVTVPASTAVTYGLGLQSAVGTDFAAQHDIASYGSDFWGQEYGGTRPVDALASAVKSALTADCALILLADDWGVDSSAFRAATEEPGGVDAYERIRSRAEELKDAVRAALLEQSPPDDADLRSAFERLGDVSKESDLAVTVWRVHGAEEVIAASMAPASPTSAGVTGSSATVDTTNAAALRDRLIAAGASVEELRIDSQEISKEDLYSSQILDAMQHAEPGAVIDGFTEGERLILVDKLGGGLLTFEQAPQLARNAYVNELLEEQLEQGIDADPLRMTADLATLLLDATP